MSFNLIDVLHQRPLAWLAAGILSLSLAACGDCPDADNEMCQAKAEKPSPGLSVLIAGSIRGSADGTGAAAQFGILEGITADHSGNLYVADMFNHTIRKITPAGVVTTFAGTAGIAGSEDGTAAVARFNYPRHVAIDSAGTLYVSDSANLTIRRITPAGSVTTPAGSVGNSGNIDGTGAAARFLQPSGVVADASGNLYVADCSNSNIRKVTQAGMVTTFAGSPFINGTPGSRGSNDGIGTAARFNLPCGGITIDAAGNLYVADTFNHTIRKITPAAVVTTIAGTPGSIGSADGTGGAARFQYPYGVAADGAGNLYVADSNNHTIRKITAAGVVTTVAGVAGVPGRQLGELPGLLSFPRDVTVIDDKTLAVISGAIVLKLMLP